MTEGKRGPINTWCIVGRETGASVKWFGQGGQNDEKTDKNFTLGNKTMQWGGGKTHQEKKKESNNGGCGVIGANCHMDKSKVTTKRNWSKYKKEREGP